MQPEKRKTFKKQNYDLPFSGTVRQATLKDDYTNRQKGNLQLKEGTDRPILYILGHVHNSRFGYEQPDRPSSGCSQILPCIILNEVTFFFNWKLT